MSRRSSSIVLIAADVPIGIVEVASGMQQIRDELHAIMTEVEAYGTWLADDRLNREALDRLFDDY